MSIQPQAGMPVLFHPHASAEGLNCGQPLAATITHVWSETMVNLQVLDMYGHTYPMSSVPLGESHALGRWCEFPEWFVRLMTPAIIFNPGALPEIRNEDLLPHKVWCVRASEPGPQFVGAGTPDPVQCVGGGSGC